MEKLVLDNPRYPWLGTGLLLLLSLLVFAPVIFGGQFFWDDYLLLVNNPLVHDQTGFLGLHGLYRVWFTTENPDYFPLTSTLFWAEWRLFGNTPLDAAFQPYHLVNALLHGGAAIFLWRTLRHLRVRGALLAALLFVVHPVNAETGAWIAEGKNTLSVCLMLASALLWVRSENRGDRGLYAASLGVFLLALLAKTSVVMLPVVLLLLLWYRGRATPAAILRTLPYFVLSLVLGLVTIWFQMHRSIQDAVVRDDGFVSRLATAGCALWFYLLKACVPVWISFSYARWNVLDAGYILAFLPLALMLILLVILWALRRRIGRGYVVALAAYIALLLPMLGFVNIFFMRYSLVSDHWQYAAMPVFCAAAASTMVWLLRGRGVRAWNITWGVALLLLAGLALDSASIASIYRTSESVWADVLRHDPDSWLANERLGEMLLERGRTDPNSIPHALVYLQRVVTLRPDLAVGYTNLGNAYLALNQVDEARRLYEKGVNAPVGSRVERAIAHVNLGLLDRRTGDAAGAERQFEQAVRINPDSTYSWLNLGVSRLARNDLSGARAAFQRSVAADETFVEPRLQLASVAYRLGDRATALEQVHAVLRIEPQNSIALQMNAALENGVGGQEGAAGGAAEGPIGSTAPATAP